MPRRSLVSIPLFVHQRKIRFYESILAENAILLASMLEMANLHKENTGLDYVIWFGEVGGQHGPRIKVCNIAGKTRQDNCFVTSVDKNPVVLISRACKLSSGNVQDIIDWIQLNYDQLMVLWKMNETGTGNVPLETLKLKRIIL